MKYIATIILTLFLATTLFANKIDDLKTDQDLMDFLRNENEKLNDFYVTSNDILYYDSLRIRIADSIGVKPWQKLDFDNNGLTDLLAYGIRSGNKYLLAVIDEGDKFTFHSFYRGWTHHTLFPVTKVIDKQVLLILHNTGQDYNKEVRNSIVETDTLVYKYGDFIEPNFNATTYDIEKIEFSTTACFGSCPVFELEIQTNRKAMFNAIQYNDTTGKFKTIIDTLNFNSIIVLLNYLDFPKLEDNYYVLWTDDQTSHLTITYNNGKTKKITDYGELGTYGLSVLYDKLFALRQNQKWK